MEFKEDMMSCDQDREFVPRNIFKGTDKEADWEKYRPEFEEIVKHGKGWLDRTAELRERMIEDGFASQKWFPFLDEEEAKRNGDGRDFDGSK